MKNKIKNYISITFIFILSAAIMYSSLLPGCHVPFPKPGEPNPCDYIAEPSLFCEISSCLNKTPDEIALSLGLVVVNAPMNDERRKELRRVYDDLHTFILLKPSYEAFRIKLIGLNGSIDYTPSILAKFNSTKLMSPVDKDLLLNWVLDSIIALDSLGDENGRG